MLPRYTLEQIERRRGEAKWTNTRMQRLIGRSLRAVTDTKALGERQVRIDCDVIQADGGTRTLLSPEVMPAPSFSADKPGFKTSTP